MLWVVEREKRTWSHQVGRRQCLEKADTQEAQGLRVLRRLRPRRSQDPDLTASLWRTQPHGWPLVFEVPGL